MPLGGSLIDVVRRLVRFARRRCTTCGDAALASDTLCDFHRRIESVDPRSILH